MTTETYIKGIIEGAIKLQFHTMFFNIPKEAENKSFTIKVSEDFIVHFQKKSPIGGNFFNVYSFRTGKEGVFFASHTSSGKIGKVSLDTYRSEGLTQNYTIEALFQKLTA
jgi:hypothetical protein